MVHAGDRIWYDTKTDLMRFVFSVVFLIFLLIEKSKSSELWSQAFLNYDVSTAYKINNIYHIAVFYDTLCMI